MAISFQALTGLVTGRMGTDNERDQSRLYDPILSLSNEL